jgi:hypothetical protein
MDFTLPVDQRPNGKGYFTPYERRTEVKRNIVTPREGATCIYVNLTL